MSTLDFPYYSYTVIYIFWELTNVRYRGGVIDEYPSRLHYFSDWIYDLNERRIVADVTKEIGGQVYPNDVNFMSTHPSAYKQLVNNPKFVENPGY